MRLWWVLSCAVTWAVLAVLLLSRLLSMNRPPYRGLTTEFFSRTEIGNFSRSLSRPKQHLSKESPGRAETRSTVEAVQRERQELLRRVCADPALHNLTHTNVSHFVLSRIFVCDHYRILFCQTPKVGNTQWKKVLLVANGERSSRAGKGRYNSTSDVPEDIVHQHDKNGLPRLSSLPPGEVSLRLRTYFKFLIVREPFDRIISAFKDKFVKNPRQEPWYRQRIAPAIVRRYGSGPARRHALRFEDFVRYLGDAQAERLDAAFGEHIIHWVTYVRLCAPCQIDYDAVGHHETLESDAPYVLRRAGVPGHAAYPPIPPGVTAFNRSKVQHYFRGISPTWIRRLYRRYEGDFRLFGYEEPSFLWM
ncbi:carbohydrate sulfotransferase 10 isoform X3 [Petromyzon marinus]|uniref:Carbohydrate sulfotransferase n=1 Tax=Petromyzon marinus TaxID=7757 RepID=A0AAJ7T759_PETMA|nr:carbohydrate sulfotransferase 10 isoform X1 [Petromyzon marinus]XP_032812623.1 carbohydrate sulfotransferase 10 isoform X1 [Petromyzon marinus]